MTISQNLEIVTEKNNLHVDGKLVGECRYPGMHLCTYAHTHRRMNNPKT